MMICKNCKGTDIKSRRNYSHGKKSKANITMTCKNCGGTAMEVKIERGRRNRR